MSGFSGADVSLNQRGYIMKNDERKESISKVDNQFEGKVVKRFFCGNFKYEGYELERTATHIKIYDTTKKKRFELPISTTVVEDV